MPIYLAVVGEVRCKMRRNVVEALLNGAQSLCPVRHQVSRRQAERPWSAVAVSVVTAYGFAGGIQCGSTQRLCG